MSVAEEAAAAGLRRVGARPPLRAYLSEVWRRRDFPITLARYRLRAANEGNRLGIAWIVLRPTLNAVIYGFVFGILQKSDTRPAHYVEYVVIGVFLWQFFTGSMSHGAKAITGNRPLVQSLSFPRITLPIATVLQELYSLLVTMAVMLVIVVAFAHWPTWKWLELIPLLGLYALLNLGIALICARLTAHLADLSNLLPYVSRILMYMSGVLWAPDKIFKHHPVVLRLFDFHPLNEVLVLGRSILLPDAYTAPTWYWLALAIWAVALSLIGVAFFWAAEERYGRVV